MCKFSKQKHILLWLLEVGELHCQTRVWVCTHLYLCPQIKGSLKYLANWLRKKLKNVTYLHTFKLVWWLLVYTTLWQNISTWKLHICTGKVYASWPLDNFNIFFHQGNIMHQWMILHSFLSFELEAWNIWSFPVLGTFRTLVNPLNICFCSFFSSRPLHGITSLHSCLHSFNNLLRSGLNAQLYLPYNTSSPNISLFVVMLC